MGRHDHKMRNYERIVGGGHHTMSNVSPLTPENVTYFTKFGSTRRRYQMCINAPRLAMKMVNASHRP